VIKDGLIENAVDPAFGVSHDENENLIDEVGKMELMFGSRFEKVRVPAEIVEQHGAIIKPESTKNYRVGSILYTTSN
jgi:hypothetical protein